MKNVVGQVVRGEDFFDRKRETAELWRRLAAGHVLMLAPRRVGKTSLMHHLKASSTEAQRVHFVDLQGVAEPAAMLSKILVATAEDAAFRRVLQTGFRELDKWLHRISELGLSVVSVKLAEEVGPGWRDIGDQLFRALVRGQDNAKTLIILDEFPLMISHILKHEGDGQRIVTELLSWFRGLRLAPELSADDKLRFLIGGSIGLDGILHRYSLIGTINDLDSFRLGPFDRPTAVDFLRGLAKSEDITLSEDVVDSILERLGCSIPFHLQLVFSRLSAECRARDTIPTLGLLDEVWTNLLGPDALKDMGHYETRLKDALAEDEAKLARALLAEACKAPGGILRQTAEGVARQALGREDSDMLRRVLNVLEHDGYLLYSPGPAPQSEGRYRFWSGLLRDWWRRQFCW